ncbi:MAG: 3-isopropylmalate dehydratase [Coriobacteriia bacterium]|nr:3-isopropylmalate dehydratase [Coriobacteriia bacterium]
MSCAPNTGCTCGCRTTYPAFKYGDDINTDYIISGKYKFKSADMEAMAVHAMEDLDPRYHEKLAKAGGGYLVAGTNFGMGSSREQAPLVLIHSQTKAVLAKSFARIFYRNAINTGLPVVICDTDQINDGDELDVDLEAGIVHNLTQGTEITFAPLPPVMAQLLADGGLVAHIRKHGGFNLEEA